MRNQFFLLLLILVIANASSGQIVGTNCFLQGQWTEVGINPMGAFGTCGSPATYHAHACCGTVTAFTPGSNMDVSHDWGHDGWAVGSPMLMGPYTQPGFPQEGWSVQVGATEYRNWASGAACTGPFMVPGGNTAYSNVGGNKTGLWVGNIVGLNIRQETKIDTQASWIVVTTKFYNTTGATINNVYYERTNDPDNTSFWSGTPVTRNIIVHQNEDSRHLVQAVAHGNTAASGTTPAYNRYNSYMSLATKDCRARCGFVPALTPSTTPQTLWAGTGTSLFLLNDSNYNDQGIFLVFNIGNIAANDSAVVSYAYIYNYPNGHSGIDSALPDPVLSVGGTRITTFPDTFDMCTLPPGVDTVPIDILYAEDKCWTWSKWTWTPGIGLSATTGAHVTVSGISLTGPTTYTITGTDSATGMRSCHNRVMYITIKPCHFAFTNHPCLGDTLKLDMYGDSVGATYFWYGPAGFTAYVRNPWKFPTTWADTGTYYVVKTIGSLHDTDFVHVTIHPLPVVTPTSNIPNTCDPLVSPFNLFVNLDSAGETFLWSGPGGFTSTMQNPVIAPFDSSLQGIYTVTGTTIWGCKATASTTVTPGVTAKWDAVIHYGCLWDTVYFTNYTVNASSYTWVFGDLTPDINTRHAMHVYKASNKIWTVMLRASNAFCSDSETHAIDARHEVRAVFDPTPDTICFNGGTNSITFNNTSFANDSINSGLAVNGSYWRFGDGTVDFTNATPPPITHTYTQPGIFPVTLIAVDAMGCPDSVTHPVHVVHLDIKSFNDTMLCISQPLALKNKIISIPDAEWSYKHFWTHTPENLDNDTAAVPSSFGIGLFTNIHTVTVPGILPDGCPAYDTMTINSILGKKLQSLTVSQTIDYGSSIQLNASNEVIYYWMPNDGSLDNNNINNPIATPKRTTTYTVYGFDDNGCRDSAYITVYVDTTMDQDVPSAFSPNGDGLNDVFKPVGMKFQNMVEFRVFNRWGQEIFYTNSKEVGWDGTFQGTKQDLGVYNYLIIVARPGQNNIAYKGNVTLIR